MSTTWYECKVKYRKTNENGIQKITTEPYLIDALSFTEAETRINDEMRAYISEEFKVTGIRPLNLYEVVQFENCDKWFKSKVSLIAYDEERGKERKTNMYLLIEANDAKEAYDNTVTAMKNSIGDYQIPSVSETKIVDIFPYISGEVE